MTKSSGGAQQLRRGDRIRVEGSCYRHYLRGLVGTVTCVFHHAVVVALDNDPQNVQRLIAQGGVSAPVNPNIPQRQFQFNEVVKIPRA